MLDIQKNHIGEIALVTVAGRIDAINASELQQDIDKILQIDPSIKIILQMEHVNYLSAAALRVLKILHTQTGSVCISQPSDRVREVMQITGLDATYQLCRSLSDAVYTTKPVVNAHTQLELGWVRKNRPYITGVTFEEWIKEYAQIAQRKHILANKYYSKQSIEDGIRALSNAGISTVADISVTGLSIQPLLQAGMRGIVYIEVMGHQAADVEQSLAEARAIIDEWRPKMHYDLQIGLALHAPYSVHHDLWLKAVDYARTEQLPLCIRVAQSPAESGYMQEGAGALKEQYNQDGSFVAPGISSIAYLEEIGALALKPLLIHAVHVDDADLARIKTFGSTVVHCPRSNMRLQCGKMPLEKFIKAGIPVLLGTDSLLASPSLNVFDEMEVAAALHYGTVEPRQIIKMVHSTLPMMTPEWLEAKKPLPAPPQKEDEATEPAESEPEEPATD